MKKQLFFERTKARLLSPNTMRLIFIIVLVILVFTFFIQISLTNGREGMQVFFQDPDDSFMDFFNVQKQLTIESPVSQGQVYPSIAYLIIYPFHPFVDYEQLEVNDPRAMQSGIMSFIVFIFIWIFIGAVFLAKLLSKVSWQKNIIIFLLFISAPMLFLIERGNINVAILALVAVFFAYYEDDNSILREVAIIALALATGSKLYPALFGLLLFKKGKFPSFFRLVGYCAASISLPFLLFEGGLTNVKTLFFNILFYSNFIEKLNNSTALMGRLGFYALFRMINIKLGGDMFQSWYITVSSITSYLMLGFSIAGSFLVKPQWKKATILVCPMILFPIMSAMYNAVFLFIPIILFLKEEEKCWFDYLYLLLFIVILNPVQYGSWIVGVSRSTIIANICIVAVNGLLCIEGFIELIRMIKKWYCQKKYKLAITHTP